MYGIEELQLMMFDLEGNVSLHLADEQSTSQIYIKHQSLILISY